MEKKFEDSVREQLRYFAQIADDATRRIERRLTDLALEIEHNNQYSASLDLSIDRMDEVYETRDDGAGNVLYLRTENMQSGEMNWVASGVERIPFSDDTKRRLKCYEYAVSNFLRIYDELEYVDELWLFDRSSNAGLGRVQYCWSNYLFPGLDIDQFYDLGLAYYDWFEAVDLPKNPQRQVVCSASPFVELFNQWIMHIKAPLYRDRYGPLEALLGIVSVHLNLSWLMHNTIETSNHRIMIIKDDSTLIGMNQAARRDVNLETYDYSKFSYDTVFEPEVGAYKRRLVSEILNLEHEKPDDVMALATKVKSEYNFTHTLQGKKYRCIKEKSKELGFYYLALLDQE